MTEKMYAIGVLVGSNSESMKELDDNETGFGGIIESRKCSAISR